MEFLPKAEILSLEELDRLCTAFVRRGVRHLRLTGGEPLMRRGVMDLVRGLSRHLETGALDDLTLTTNGVRLREFSVGLAKAGVRRINVSLDSLDRATFARIARGDVLHQVLDGISAALDAGLRVKINTVALKRDNAAELPALIQWAHRGGMDLTLIETMPLGAVGEERSDQFLSLASVRRELSAYWSLTDLPERSGGPARYVRVAETGGKLGFITPLSHNFCESCNRVRVTCTGTLYMCLGQDAAVDLRDPLRRSVDDGLLDAAIDRALDAKPKSHDFMVPRARRAARRRASHVGDGRLDGQAGFPGKVSRAGARQCRGQLACRCRHTGGVEGLDRRRDPALGRAMAASQTQVIVNQSVVRDFSRRICEADEIAFLPPMSGG